MNICAGFENREKQAGMALILTQALMFGWKMGIVKKSGRLNMSYPNHTNEISSICDHSVCQVIWPYAGSYHSLSVTHHERGLASRLGPKKQYYLL